MNKRHIAMVIARYPPVIGGTELQCRELSRKLVQNGHKVSVLTERHDLTLPEHEMQDGVAIYRFHVGDIPLASTFLFGEHLKAWITAHPDVTLLHAHMLAGPALAALFWGRRLGKPVVLKIAGAGATGDIGTSQRRLRGSFKLWLFKRWARHVVCPSPRTLHEIETQGLAPDRLHLIPNGVNTTRFKPLIPGLKAAMRVSLNLGEKDKIALYVGRWAEGKGLENLLTVWENAQALSNFPWKLVLVVNQAPPAEQAARMKALGTAVRLVVNPLDPLPYYQTADVAVLLSENEGLSNFLLEAMASGLPLITTQGAVVSPPDESIAWSWLTTSDPADVLTVLQAALVDPNELGTKGNAARTKAVNTFSGESVVKAYERLYAEAVN